MNWSRQKSSLKKSTKEDFLKELGNAVKTITPEKEDEELLAEIIRLLRAGKGISEVADALQISKDKVNEIAELLK